MKPIFLAFRESTKSGQYQLEIGNYSRLIFNYI